MAQHRHIGCVTVFGGTGFLGGEIVKRLADRGNSVRVAVRNPDNVRIEGPTAQATEILPVYADVRDETSVGLAMGESDAIVNAVGLYVETRSETFEAVHELGAMNVAHQAVRSGAGRLVHISGIGADPYSPSDYVRARGKGDLMVSDVCPGATILQPSALFGPTDQFINTLAKIVATAPVLPLFGRGSTMLQPVYVADVAEAVVSALTDPGSTGKTYELGGPQIYSYRGLIELLLSHTGRRRLLLPVPFVMWDVLATLSSALPNPPLTRAQVTLMKHDNTVGVNALSFENLGIEPRALEDVLPEYRL